ncbi:staygreen family protein [uncultured Clostridium sp.]|jgi:hypothetical protein|uniref:staygreen family protein n=1 Tax=uncultured Clostridium sp. TaxID=59620 RepID=UPI0026313BAE|nr:staygreen family protein [uncultured Clostridium sp.]
MADNNKRNVICDYKGSVNQDQPVNHRRYTFLEKEENDKLVIGLRFDSRNTSSNRNEILGQWAISDDRYVLYFHINIEADENVQSIAVRNSIIRSKLAGYIRKILNADKKLISLNEELFKSPIIVYFKCALPYYNRVENWGTVEEYLSEKDLIILQYNRREVEIIKLLTREHIDKKMFEFYNGSTDYKIGEIELVEIDSKEILGIYNLEFFVSVIKENKTDKFKMSLKIYDDIVDIIQFEKV